MKPTIFFSHSSKDKDMIMPIRNRILQITGESIVIFMSSDGQSIPFGNNWIHKIEEGLNQARIMFVFVTPTSINSAWIYFEAGYAYSKGIKVVPVGVGVNIGSLKAPLNLLQGYDITSKDSLNNFVTVINREFSCSFPESFSDDDYFQVETLLLGNSSELSIERYFEKGDYYIPGKYHSQSGELVTVDIKGKYEQIREYLNTHSIEFAENKGILLFNGIRIEKKTTNKTPTYERGRPTPIDSLTITVSTMNFRESLEKCIEVLNAIHFDHMVHFEFSFRYGYDCITDETAVSALVAMNKSYSLFKTYPGTVVYDNRITFRGYQVDKGITNRYNVLGIIFDITKNKVNDVIELIDRLYSDGYIYEKL